MIRLLYALIGWIIGAFLLTQYGGIFVEPQKLSSNWRVISPMLEELSGEPQIGLGVHIADGALRITKHLLYPSDTLVVNHEQEIKDIHFKLSPNSGTLVMSLGNTSKHFIFVEANVLHPSSPSDNGIPLQNHEVHLEYIENSLYIVQDGWKKPITSTRPQKIEFMTVSNSASIEYISMIDNDGTVIIQEDYRGEGKLKHAMELGGLLGLLLGLLLSYTNKNQSIVILRCILTFVPLFLILQITRDSWMYFCELLYLSQNTGWELAQYASICLYLILLMIQIPATKLLMLTSRRDPLENVQMAQWIWGILALCSVGYQYQNTLYWILYLGLFFLILPRLAYKAQLRSIQLYIMDIPTLLLPLILDIEIGMLMGILWRMVILMSNITQFRKWNPTVLADTFFICFLLIPIQSELFLRSTYINTVWSPEGLQVQYRSEDMQTTLPMTWKGVCGKPPTTQDFTIVVSGGSSTGGAYQFKDEPEAFFSTKIHKELCSQIPSHTKVALYNHGSADLNSHLIAKRFFNITNNQPDIVILYIGVNDVLTQRYPQTIRQRESSTTKTSSIPFLFSSRLLTGLSIPLQSQQDVSNQALVSEVPPEDAKLNLKELRENLPATTHLIVIPEIIVSHLRNELKAYDVMLQEFAAENVSNTHYFVPTSKSIQEQDALLADRNHLNRQGNQWLGSEIAHYLREQNLFLPNSIQEDLQEK